MSRFSDFMKSMPTEDEVRLAFLNTPLEAYSHYAFLFLSTEPLVESSGDCLGPARGRIQTYVSECESLVKMILAAKTGKLTGKGWCIDSEEDLSFLINRAEDYLLKKLGYFDAIFLLHHPDDKPDGSNIGTWGRMLSPFPRIKDLEFNKSAIGARETIYLPVSQIFNVEELERILVSLHDCVKISKTFPLESDDSVQYRFVEYMLEHGVPKTREVYRELYRALDMYGRIPDYVKESHSKTNSFDPQSNYIKSFVTTISKRNNFNEQNSTSD